MGPTEMFLNSDKEDDEEVKDDDTVPWQQLNLDLVQAEDDDEEET